MTDETTINHATHPPMQQVKRTNPLTMLSECCGTVRYRTTGHVENYWFCGDCRKPC